MSEDKYTTIFLRQMEAIVFIFPQIFFQRAGKVSTNSSPFITYEVHFSVFAGTTEHKTCPFFSNNHKTLSNLELNLKRRLLS